MAFGVAADFECPLAGRQQRNRLYVEMYAIGLHWTKRADLFRKIPSLGGNSIRLAVFRLRKLTPFGVQH